MNTERELAEVLALLEKATQTEWEVCERGMGDADLWFRPYEAWCQYDAPLIRGTLSVADAMAFCAAVNFLRKHGPALLSRADGGGATLVARKHRGSLADSMATAKSIPATEAALRDFFEVPDGTLAVSPYGWDKRIGWDTHIVTVDGSAVGFTSAAMANERGE